MALIDVNWLQNGGITYTAQEDRQVLQALGGPGVGAPTHFKVTGTSHTALAVAPGVAVVPGGVNAAAQGHYVVKNDNSGTLLVTGITLPASGNHRNWLVYIEVHDSAYSGAANDAVIVASGGNTVTTAQVPAPPTMSGISHLPLAEVVVTSSGSCTVYNRRGISSGLEPIGGIIAWPGAAGIISGATKARPMLPYGYVPCDGTSYTSSQYPELFEIIGYTFGGSAGNFQVPLLTDRMIIGVSGTRALANTGGAAGPHTLAATSLPQHQHAIQSHGHAGSTCALANHEHFPQASSGGTSYFVTHGNPLSQVYEFATGGPPTPKGLTDRTGSITGTNANALTIAGSGILTTDNSAAPSTTIPTLSPYLALNYIIKAE